MLNFEKVLQTGSGIRLHGNGFIQIDMPDKTRLHIWDPSLLARAQSVSTQIHDHRFSFESESIFGVLIHQPYVEKYDGVRYDVYHPRMRHDEDTTLEDSGLDISIEPLLPQSISRGERYQFEFGEFHETRYDDLAITLMTKTHVSKRWTPRVLCRQEQNPDNSFDRYQYSDKILWGIVRQAFHRVEANANV